MLCAVLTTTLASSNVINLTHTPSVHGTDVQIVLIQLTVNREHHNYIRKRKLRGELKQIGIRQVYMMQKWHFVRVY